MPATRRRFRCNHKGFGVYCHRCKAADGLEAQIKKTRSDEKKLKLRQELRALRSVTGLPGEAVFASDGLLL